LNKKKIERYQKTFGKLNYSTKIGDFILVIVNSEYLGKLKKYLIFSRKRFTGTTIL
jgi:hypothetical protein